MSKADFKITRIFDIKQLNVMVLSFLVHLINEGPLGLLRAA